MHSFPCIWCFFEKNDIFNLTKSTTWLKAEIEVAWMRTKKILMGLTLFIQKKQSCCRREQSTIVRFTGSVFFRKLRSMLRCTNLTNVEASNDRYSTFSEEPLHFLLLGIWKKLKECMVVYFSSYQNTSPPLPQKSVKERSILVTISWLGTRTSFMFLIFK